MTKQEFIERQIKRGQEFLAQIEDKIAKKRENAYND